MKTLTHAVIIFVLSCLLLLLFSTEIKPLRDWAIKPSAKTVLARNWQGAPSEHFRIGSGSISGGNYKITSFKLEVLGTSSGGDYVLSQPLAPTLRGSGCCCLYLPCLIRNPAP